jgi:hypothetical protein
MRTASVAFTCIFVGLVAVPVAAQTTAPARDLRRQIYAMEGALAKAVQFGAKQVNREIRSFSPELFSLAGEAQAHGVYLDGYGVFFDVGVPILRQSMIWSLRQIMEPNDPSLRRGIDALKQMVANERDSAKRHDIENAISRLELELGPQSPPFGGAATTDRATAPQASGRGAVGAALGPQNFADHAPAAPPPPDAAATATARERVVMQDPNRAYTDAVKDALIDAMIDFAVPMLLASDEWLTVAARDNAPRDTFAPQDPYEETVTILLRIKGADLAAYRTGKIDSVEAKKRVQIQEF